MTEKDILSLIEQDPWMMDVLKTAENLNLPDWLIGAGFVRNKVWDYLHGINRNIVPTRDIDLAYFNPDNIDEQADDRLSKQLKKQTGIEWEIKNQAYTHKINGLKPFASTEDAIAHWVETATAVGVRLQNGQLELICPHGISDLVNLVLRPSPDVRGVKVRFRQRIKEKKWLEKWPKLEVVSN